MSGNKKLKKICEKQLEKRKFQMNKDESRKLFPETPIRHSYGTRLKSEYLNKLEELNMMDTERANCEGGQLRAVFPEEVWILILGQVEDPKELQHMSNASLYFRRLLLPNRVQFLFASIMKLLPEMLTEPKKLPCWSARKMISPPVTTSKIKTPVEIINLRLVCSFWRKIVDNFYQTREFRKYQKNHADGFNWAVEIFRSNGAQHVQKFLDYFDKSHCQGDDTANPFLGRTIFLRFVHYEYDQNDRNRGDQCYNKLIILLRKYGHHVWNCTLNFCPDRRRVPHLTPCYKALRKFLELMPNLKALHVSFHSYNDKDFDVCDIHTDRYDYGEGSENQDPSRFRLKKEIKSNPLKTLEHLRTLYINNLPTKYLHELIRSNNHISVLEINRKKWRQEYDLSLVPMQNLTEATLLIRSASDMEILKKSVVDWKLAKLDIQFAVFLQWSKMFGLIKLKWADTLTHLSIILPSTPETNKKASTILRCANLRPFLPKIKFINLHTLNRYNVVVYSDDEGHSKCF